MKDYQDMPDTDEGDNGGVHINSGIPNKAFYLAATGIGGNAWETAGPVWYDSLLASTTTTNFQEFADTTFLKAGQRYGIASKEQKAIAEAWNGVGIKVAGTLTAKP
jgi:Zn-dependent metalloprotease